MLIELFLFILIVLQILSVFFNYKLFQNYDEKDMFLKDYSWDEVSSYENEIDLQKDNTGLKKGISTLQRKNTELMKENKYLERRCEELYDELYNKSSSQSNGVLYE